MRELVALARDEGVESVFRVERRGVARCDGRRIFVAAASVRLAGGGFLLPFILRERQRGGVWRGALVAEQRWLLDGLALGCALGCALAAGGFGGFLHLARRARFLGLVLVARGRQVEADELNAARRAEHIGDGILEDGDVAVLDPVLGEVIRRGELERALIEADGAHGQQPFFAGHL